MKNFLLSTRPKNEEDQEKTKSEKDSIFGMTTCESSNFKDMWSFNHPNLSMKNYHEKLHQVEVLVEKGEF